MTIYEIIKARRSVRAYREKEIDEETLNKILGAGRMAPSAHNSQDYKFIVVKDLEQKKNLSRAAFEQKFIAEAPIVIVAVSLNPEAVLESGVLSYALDIGIALDHMTLAAVEEGLGTCWIGSFSQEQASQAIGLPNNYKTVAMITLGVPYDDPGVKSRKDLKNLINYDYFSENK